MSEWWTYRPADFLMFSPQAYARVFEAVNAAWWPWQGLVLVLGLLGLALLAGLAGLASGRAWLAVGCGLGLAWALCAGVFVQGHYVAINWAAASFVPAFGVLAAALPLLAWLVRDGRPAHPGRRRVALALAVWALLLHPLVTALSGPGWLRAEFVALTPDPTALATAAWMLALPQAPAGRRKVLVTVLATLLSAWVWATLLAWGVFSGVLLWALGSGQAGLMLGLLPAVLLLRLLQPRLGPVGAA